MAPTGSDPRMTELAEPTTPTAGARAEDDGTTPFGDWREQLRERVKEIRARKHAAHRADVDDIALSASAAATAEKLDAARAQAARQMTGEIVTNVHSADEDPAPTAVEPSAVAEPVPAGEVSTTGETSFAGEMSPAAPPPQPPAAPLFQEEPIVFADDPLLEIDADFDLRGNSVAASAPVPEANRAGTDDPPALPLRNEEIEVTGSSVSDPPGIDDEALPEASVTLLASDPVESEGPAHGDQVTPTEPGAGIPEPGLAASTDAPAPDNPLLQSIPPELRDVEIPAWALPREPSRVEAPPTEAEPWPAGSRSAELEGAAPTDGESGTAAIAEPAATAPAPVSVAHRHDAVEDSPLEEHAAIPEPAAGNDADVHLVGEFVSAQGDKRTDLGPPPEAPIPTAELLDRSIGDLSGLEDAAVEIAPPGGLVDVAEFEDLPKASSTSRPLPGLFDAAEDPAPVATTPAAAVDAIDMPDANAPSAGDLGDLGVAPSHDLSTPDAAAEDPFEEPARAAVTDGPAPQRPGIFDEPLPAEPAATPFDADDIQAGSNDLAAADEARTMQWDDAADPEPEAVLAARRRHAEAFAPVSDRVVSAVADALVLIAIGLVLVIAGASAAGSAVVPFVQAAPVPFVAVWLLFGLVYGVIFVGTCGQTLGKMAMRVRVIGADTFHVGYGRAALRGLAYAAAALPAGLGLLTTFRDPEHRGLHDRLTSTRVVKA